MTQARKRIPGERNPGLDPTAVHHIQNAANAFDGSSSGDLGARHAIAAWDRWRQRRRKRKAIAAYEASKLKQ